MNWGWKIAIVYALFVIGMLSVVVYSTKFDTNLVGEDYYEKEVAFQQEIDKKQNTINDSLVFNVKVLNDSVVIEFPRDVASGKVIFMRAADINSDKNFDLKKNQKKQSFPLDLFKNGSYEVQIDWRANNKEYYWEEKIVI